MTSTVTSTSHTPLWLARHAPVLLSRSQCYGQTDVPADPQATHTLAQQLAAALPRRIVVLSSPLQRCELLAQILCGLRADLTYKTDPRLQEINFGSWEGQSWDSIGAAATAAWTQDFMHYTPGGGESVTQLMQRVREALHDVQRNAAQQLMEPEQPAQPVLWLTHAGVINAVTAWAAHWAAQPPHRPAHPANPAWHPPAPGAPGPSEYPNEPCPPLQAKDWPPSPPLASWVQVLVPNLG
jgi:alpha-ribazole phosphatase